MFPQLRGFGDDVVNTYGTGGGDDWSWDDPGPSEGPSDAPWPGGDPGDDDSGSVAQAVCEAGGGHWTQGAMGGECFSDDDLANLCAQTGGRWNGSDCLPPGGDDIPPIPPGAKPELACRYQGGTWDALNKKCITGDPRQPPQQPGHQSSSGYWILGGIVVGAGVLIYALS